MNTCGVCGATRIGDTYQQYNFLRSRTVTRDGQRYRYTDGITWDPDEPRHGPVIIVTCHTCQAALERCDRKELRSRSWQPVA